MMLFKEVFIFLEMKSSNLLCFSVVIGRLHDHATGHTTGCPTCCTADCMNYANEPSQTAVPPNMLEISETDILW